MDQRLVLIFLLLIVINTCRAQSDRPSFPTELPTGATPMHSDTGVITSPNYPSFYPYGYRDGDDRYATDSSRYLASIFVPKDVQYVELRFTTFDVEQCGKTRCACDGLYVSALTNPLCGDSLPNGDGVIKIDQHQIKNKTLLFSFYSDYTTPRQGFYMTYRLVRGVQDAAVRSNPCGYATCPYCPGGSYYSRDMYGCQVCHCYDTTTLKPAGALQHSLILQVLMNLEHRAETLEKSAHDLQEELKMAISAMQAGQVRRSIPEDDENRQ